ncbi:NAD(P)-dependent oxidoreductase [Rhizobium sp. SG_E_25_P2]|uniref:NAD-dependent epimerase/dehydratase family protein n=1 Tax=Rhizobium sp. SG_E_25_P2 TaxID=2879942 RepID=UPI0024733BE6|nr:NAD(P)-dependent oxidoreductase [Rhizobium sp. SG_E_25_P2]
MLVTGGTGFVGRQIVKSLLSRGYGVRLTARPDRGVSAACPGLVDIVPTADLFGESEAWWLSRLEGVDAVIHAAWFVEPGLYLDSAENIRCLQGSLRLADAACLAGVRRFVGIGTCFEYRLPNSGITDTSPLGPFTLYAAAKLAFYLAARRRFDHAGVDFAWARLFYLFGEGEHPARLFPTLHRKLKAGEAMSLSAGDKIRDFLNVEIAGADVAGLVDTGQTGVVNVCSGEPVTLRDAAERIADLYGARHLLSFGAAQVHPRDPQAVAGLCNVIRR